jgi:molybdopterin synthase catalytic subunit
MHAVIRHIEFTANPLSPEAIWAQLRSPDCGAQVLFVGTTRRQTGSRTTDFLVYECYEPMARKSLESLIADASQRWDLRGVAIVHRLGRVDVGEASIVVAIASPHRNAAFAAGAWLMDEIKRCVPIWKQEHWADGSVEWVHPGLVDGNQPSSARPPSSVPDPAYLPGAKPC